MSDQDRAELAQLVAALSKDALAAVQHPLVPPQVRGTVINLARCVQLLAKGVLNG